MGRVENPLSSEIEMDLIGNMIILPVQIGDTDTTFNFLFDSGAFTIVDERLAANFGFQAEQLSVVGGSGGGVGLIGFMEIPMIKVGNTEVFDIGVGMFDMSGISSALGIPIHGILGNNFFKDLMITFDYQSEIFKIDVNTDTLPLGLKMNFIQQVNTSNAPQITATVDSIHYFKAIFDTGSDGYISLPLSLIDQLGYDSSRVRTAQGIMSSGLFGNALDSRLILSKSIQMGKIYLDEVVCSSSYLDVALIGSEYMKDMKVTINYPQQTLVLYPHESYDRSYTQIGSGFSHYKGRSGYFVVSGVWNGSAADIAGLMSGDIITKVNGVSVLDKPNVWFWYIDNNEYIPFIDLEVIREDMTLDIRIQKKGIFEDPSQ